MEIRFDMSGSVRTRSFEVLPTQIYVAGFVEDEEVVSRARTVLAYSIIRIICSCYTLLTIFIKIKYRDVIGGRQVAGSVFKDLIQIVLAVTPVIMGYNLQAKLDVKDLANIEIDLHQLGRDT